MTVNALATGLIVFKICKMFREVKTTPDYQYLGLTGGSKIRRIIFILIESGMALFSIQLARLVLSIIGTDAAYATYCPIACIHQMLNVSTRSAIAALLY